MEVFRLYTEDINREFIRTLFDANFDSYSLFNGLGIWQGKEEASLCAEVVAADATTRGRLEAIAEAIKSANNQDAVLITRAEVDAKLI